MWTPIPTPFSILDTGLFRDLHPTQGLFQSIRNMNVGGLIEANIANLSIYMDGKAARVPNILKHLRLISKLPVPPEAPIGLLAKCSRLRVNEMSLRMN